MSDCAIVLLGAIACLTYSIHSIVEALVKSDAK